jgi:molybdopterin-binding protein
VKVGDIEVISVVTRESAERMQLKAGRPATAVIKATEVMMAVD